MEKRTDIREGMVVRSADGDRLGRVVNHDENRFQVEKGIFFPKDYLATYDQIATVQGDDVYLKWGTELVEQQYDRQFGAGSYEIETRDEQWVPFSRRRMEEEGAITPAVVSEAVEKKEVESTDRDIRLQEEQLSAHKKGMHEVGRVRIVKTVVTEDKHFTVPVTREEVRVERVAVDRSTAQGETFASDFKEETITVPILEEEVEVTKRPVVREELHVKTQAEQVEREVAGTVRKEEARIEREETEMPGKKKAG